jgi:RND family efflux transporter MFP subunit
MLADIEPAEVEAQTMQAQQLDDKAARDLERGEKLRAEEVISLEQLQNLRTQREMAAAALRAARFNRQRAAIVAPAAGTILRRLAEQNEQVQAGQPVLVLGSAARALLVRAAISDRNLVQLKRGDRVGVTLDAMPGATLTGTVTSLALAADTASGLFPLEVELEATKLGLASGMIATLRIVAPAGGEQLVRVPASAIVAADGDRASVFVVESGKANRRAVRVAFLEDAQVALSSGVRAGEQVVSAGAPYLDDGEVVRATAAAASVTAAP